MKFKPNPSAARELARSAEMGRHLGKVAEDAVGSARRLAPRRTGRLADSIDHTVELGSDGWEASVYFSEWYGKLWEFGHRGRSKPFLRPGVQEAISRVGGRWKPQ